MKSTETLRLAATTAALTALAACSGGGDGGNGSTTLSVSLMDAPVDDVTEVKVQIAAIWLKSPGGPAQQLQLTSTTPMTVDLLAHGSENAAVLVDEAAIEPGSYEWLAMDVNAEFDTVFDSYVMTDSGGMVELRVPSGRVRLVSGFEVAANQALKLVFDWDLRTGLVHSHGNPGEFFLQPAFRMLDVSEYGVLTGTIQMGTVTDTDNDCNADDTDGLDYGVGNVVYVYAGHDVVPDDIDGSDSEPTATAEALANPAGDYEYRIALAPGDYTVAFTCRAAKDLAGSSETGNLTPPGDTVVFFPAANVSISAATPTPPVDF